MPERTPRSTAAILADFEAAVRSMRELQREYFDQARRKPDTLGKARAAERTVDGMLRVLATHRDAAPSLFDAMSDPAAEPIARLAAANLAALDHEDLDTLRGAILWEQRRRAVMEGRQGDRR